MKLAEFSLFLLIIVLTIYAEVVDAQRHRRKQGRPNFVLLFVDDLGYGDLGFTGHPTTKTPNIDKLAYNGKVLTTWYSGCNVCTGSRAALMTGRQFPRTGLPGVLGPTGAIGLNGNETTIAEQLKSKGGYTTAIIGKWHLGQRNVYLPANRGFDYYLGIPYSDDMGKGYESSCPATQKDTEEGVVEEEEELEHYDEEESNNNNPFGSYDSYKNGGFLEALMNDTSKGKTIVNEELLSLSSDPAGQWLPLVYQDNDQTRVLEQPLDYTTLAEKYNSFALDFIEKSKDEPFFLYMPFSHVHATSSTPKLQYAGCNFKKSTKRGAFGDALAEADWIVGNIMQKLRDSGLEEDTLILFTSDNGPWLNRGVFSGGSEGLFTGRFAGYANTGKGTTWEGGIRMPAFAYWPGKITPHSRSAEIVSSLDVFPTLSSLAGLSLPINRTYDGRDMSDILLNEHGSSKHDFLFFYSTCSGDRYWSVSSVRYGKYKAHWCTMPGLQSNQRDMIQKYDPPLLFDVERDPSESEPISFNTMPKNPEDAEAMRRILKAYAMEKATFEFGQIDTIPDQPGETVGQYGICCDRFRDCNCPVGDEKKKSAGLGIFNLGTKEHHDRYHATLGEEEPWPPRTVAQKRLHLVERHPE